MVNAKKFLRRADGDDAARFEQGDARGEQERFAEIVGDEHDGLGEAAGQGAEFALQFGAGDGVERAERLVHEKNWRVGSEGAGDADALALAAGEFTGAARGEFGGMKADKTQQFRYARGDSRGIPLFEPGHEADIFRDRKMGKQAGLLNDVANAAAQADGVPAGGGAALDKHLACRRKEQSVDEPEDSGLTAAAAAEKHQRFARVNRKRNIANKSVAVRGRDAVGDATEFNYRIGNGHGFRIHFD